MSREVKLTLIKARLACKGNRLVITASATPIGGEGKTNFMKLPLIGWDLGRIG